MLTKLGPNPATIFNQKQASRQSYYLGQERMHRAVSTELNTPGEPADDRETTTLNDECPGDISFRMVPTRVKFASTGTSDQ